MPSLKQHLFFFFLVSGGLCGREGTEHTSVKAQLVQELHVLYLYIYISVLEC